MGVIAAVEQVDERSGSMDQQFHRKYSRRFLVELDDPTTGELTILLSGFVPLVNSSHPNDLAALAQEPKVSVADPDAPYFRYVSIPYSTRSQDPDRQNKDPTESPTLQPPTVTWTHAVGTRLFTRTADTSAVRRIIDGANQTGGASFANIRGTPNGTWPVQNSAGEPFDTTPETEERRLVLTIVRNESSYDPNRALQYMDTTNNDTWLIAGHVAQPGEARCVQFDGQRQFGKQIPYYAVTYRFEFAPDPVDLWDFVIRDYGHYSIDQSGGTGNYKQVRPAATNGSATPWVNLNGLGTGARKPDESPVYLGFRRFKRMDFSTFNFKNL